MFEFVSVTSSFQVTMTNTLKMYIGYRIYLLIIVKSWNLIVIL